MEWSGEDGAGSGAATYDLEISEDGGVTWTRLLTDTQQTNYHYPGQPAHTYTFRVRATDNVNNTSPWAEATTIVAQVTKYYTFGGQRIAMRQGGVVYYLHTDHLGSVSRITDHASRITAQQRYYPYGEVRWSAGTLPTDFTFTGQRWDSGLGLLDYRARFYDPVLGRFVSADSIVPEPRNLQAWNRYSYVLGNPLKCIDFDGHRYEEPLDIRRPPPPPPPPFPDPRDLTIWLISEMTTNATGPEAAEMLVFNALGRGIGDKFSPVGISAKATELGLRGIAAYKWYNLVKDSARWDFKDQIKDRLGRSVKLGSKWFEFSTPGNIHYAYVGRAVGFSTAELHVGATIAQIRDAFDPEDPVHVSDLLKWTGTGFDQPSDYWAIEFGSALYDHGPEVTEEGFGVLLVDYTSLIGTVSAPPLGPPETDWPYWPGYFDNPGK